MYEKHVKTQEIMIDLCFKTCWKCSQSIVYDTESDNDFT